MSLLLWIFGCQFFSGSTHVEMADGRDLPPVVALVTIDTWRADHIGPDHTPNIWRFAKDGELYTQAYSPMGLTTPAHATMLTGLHPWEHGAEANNHHGYTLNSEVSVVPEQYDGYATGAFVSAYPAGPSGGLHRGWDVFDGPESGERPGSIAVERALAWLPTDRPALLWVHLYEPHGPYIGEGATERERYGEEVKRADEALGPLLKVLESRGARIVVTSDHGEVLDEERCSYQHERSISDHVLRVPLVRWSPEIVARRIDGMVGLSDVPALLRGEEIAPREHWLAQSGMCEQDCAPGCAPEGLEGRDAVAIDPGGRWIQRPGKGLFKQRHPADILAEQAKQVPPLRAPETAANQKAKSLGYLDL